MTVMFILLVSGLLASSVEAAITGWTEPAITGAASGSGKVSNPIPESTPIGVTGITIAAISSETLTYAIIDQPTAGLFTIADTGADAGKISITALLDFETTPSYVIKVTALDGTEKDEDNKTSTIPTATATITLNVGNVGPVFAKSSKEKCAQQESSGGTTITTIDASLQDGSSGTLSFVNIKDGDTVSTIFEIDGTSGTVKVITGQSLDNAKLYTLIVEASDGTKTDTMELKVNVGDCGSTASMVSPINLFVLLMTFIVSINKYVN